MNPPPLAYNPDGNTVTLEINWAVFVAGPEHFEPTPGSLRRRLRIGDELRKYSEDAGLSKEIIDWLKGGPELLTLPRSHFE